MFGQAMFGEAMFGRFDRIWDPIFVGICILSPCLIWMMTMLVAFIVEAQWDDPCAGFTDTDIPVHWQMSEAFLSYNHSENAI